MAMAAAKSGLFQHSGTFASAAGRNIAEQRRFVRPTKAGYAGAVDQSVPRKFSAGSFAGFKFGVTRSRSNAQPAKTGVRSALMPWTWDQQRAVEEEPSYIVMWPTAFSEVISAVSALKQGTTVILNLNGVKGVDEQQRCVDFVAGGCHALDGHQEYLAECVFLFAPPEVKVAASMVRDSSA
ncbi:hypothetical protein KFL_000090060 [Klebsormidium nitens]|uniref:Cell division protein SepF n=1 Tax=Klebsormidium nitens TaxID=105231 RepID=A0A1Y1HI60_KLENI|nr:hypothetical protein KFL_000090060 [Klebsormidium nitens]|eukprot:GAQ78160.1 hypothetical protein KFL_000090060 [Klebsormidium nitens]